ncbi:MAG TPA: MBL fold metallo-hydrolase [Armatimonadota bacterium]|jgi:L-ascorbate 6-phosphate lactonase
MLAKRLRDTRGNSGEVALFFLGQAGFAIKTAVGKLVVIDPYLTDACERLFGEKRMLPCPIAPEELHADLIASTHAHADHLDPDGLPIYVQCPTTAFLGAPDCRQAYMAQGLAADRYTILATGDTCTRAGITFRAIFADHGANTPDAVGLLLDVDGVTVYFTGDTAYRPNEIRASLGDVSLDLMIAPINGQFGNMSAPEAVQLAALLRPRIVIASHFWMFVEHVGRDGDPSIFRREAAALPAETRALIMAPGELLRYEAPR